ncbi:MAG: UrcA family protein [Pseudomonadota bacterium]
MKRFTQLGLALLVSTTAITGVVAPAASADTKTVSVNISNIDLNTASGAQQFADRVQAAAEEACYRSGDRSSLQVLSTRGLSSVTEACEIEAVEGLMSQVSQPNLLAAVGERFPSADLSDGHMMTADASTGSFAAAS